MGSWSVMATFASSAPEVASASRRKGRELGWQLP
jgi:hypothetical protein